MDRCGFGQPYIPVDATARIPPRRIGWIVQTDCHLIITARCNIGCEIHTPRSITIRPPAYQVTIEPHHGIRHCAFYIEEDGLACVSGRNIQLLSVPGYTGTGRASTRLNSSHLVISYA